MFKGIRGFLYVGGYIIPIFAAIFAMWAYHKVGNTAAMVWAGITIIWILDAFFKSVAVTQWKDLYGRTQALCDEMIRYIRSHQEIVPSEEKDSQKSSKKE